MSKLSPSKFPARLLATMRMELDAAVNQIDKANRTPATKAKMAQRILRTASTGVTDARELRIAAMDEGKVPAD